MLRDAGPVIAGFGVAANAFGVGAARKNGRFDLAWPLSTEMLAAVWELPNGKLAMPRIRSNLSDAPMLGEAALLWLLSVQPEKGFPVRTGGKIPTFVYVVIIGALMFGIWGMAAAVKAFTATLREPEPAVLAPKLQAFLWTSLIVGAIGASCLGRILPGFALLLAALLVPRGKRCAPDESAQVGDKDASSQVGRAEV